MMVTSLFVNCELLVILLNFVYKYCKIQFFRDADETIAWITEKDAVLSSDDYGRDLASVQALQRKHEGIERDLAALEEKVRYFVSIDFILLPTHSIFCLISNLLKN